VVDVPSVLLAPDVGSFVTTRHLTSGDSIVPNAVRESTILTERTVDEPVELLPHQAPPRYPPQLERAGVGGDVLVQFVVDTSGRVERGSVAILQSSHDEFASAVQQRLAALRFVPARARGRVVRQLVEQRFTFEVVRR
jgi:TonB family protein